MCNGYESELYCRKVSVGFPYLAAVCAITLELNMCLCVYVLGLSYLSRDRVRNMPAEATLHKQ